MTEVIVTDEVKAWYESLDERDSDAVYRTVGMLERLGPLLGFPH